MKAKTLFEVGLYKTLRFNLKYLPWRQAVRLPVVVSRHCRFRTLRGSVRIEGEVKPGMIRLGFGNVGIFDSRRSRSIWDVRDEVVFAGPAYFGHGFKISVVDGGRLYFGKNFLLSAESSIVACKSVRFGDGCLCS